MDAKGLSYGNGNARTSNMTEANIWHDGLNLVVIVHAFVAATQHCMCA